MQQQPQDNREEFKKKKAGFIKKIFGIGSSSGNGEAKKKEQATRNNQHFTEVKSKQRETYDPRYQLPEGKEGSAGKVDNNIDLSPAKQKRDRSVIPSSKIEEVQSATLTNTFQ